MSGIDYSMPFAPQANRNPETGIRYGIVSVHELADWILDECEFHYAKSCPECGEEIPDNVDVDILDACECGWKPRDSSEWYSDEPIDCTLDRDGVSLRIDDMGDVWIFQSPVLTTGRHCSPCAPGAVTISREPVEDGPQAYSLPAEFWRSETD